MDPDSPNTGTTSFPQALETRLRLKLHQWVRRTVLWGVIFAMLAAVTGGWGKVVLIIWGVFSVLSLAGILFGLHMARRLQAAAADSEDGRFASPGDRGVIDIEAEVVDPPQDKP